MKAGAVTIKSDTARVTYTGKICATVGKKCVNNTNTKTTDPSFILSMTKSNGTWYVGVPATNPSPSTR